MLCVVWVVQLQLCETAMSWLGLAWLERLKESVVNVDVLRTFFLSGSAVPALFVHADADGTSQL